MPHLAALVRRLFAPPYQGRHALGVPTTRSRPAIETWAQATYAAIAARHELETDHAAH